MERLSPITSKPGPMLAEEHGTPVSWSIYIGGGGVLIRTYCDHCDCYCDCWDFNGICQDVCQVTLYEMARIEIPILKSMRMGGTKLSLEEFCQPCCRQKYFIVAEIAQAQPPHQASPSPKKSQ